MEKFCKLFESEVYGQTLAKLDHAQDQEGAELRIYVQPESLGVCTIATFYGDTDADWGPRRESICQPRPSKSGIGSRSHLQDGFGSDRVGNVVLPACLT